MIKKVKYNFFQECFEMTLNYIKNVGKNLFFSYNAIFFLNIFQQVKKDDEKKNYGNHYVEN